MKKVLITVQISKFPQVAGIFNRTLKPSFIIRTQNLDN
jgi:hypothetical protein